MPATGLRRPLVGSAACAPLGTVAPSKAHSRFRGELGEGSDAHTALITIELVY